MYHVYILLDANGKKYIGYSNDLKRRLWEHQNGKSFYTRRLEDVKIYYYESYSNKDLARAREKNLKKYGSSYHGLLKRLKLK
ncbi:MAG: hypothetical protein COX77_01945 [Candidatus Komeilibacteria bacterium CG_4_10_14_0_2_um_filter_37_10]|uniref:GIY-YIG domain-containing protein n=1 Tax=Candidatus Komeilibacteria bacterium CG_4_10_14_0_2_um_filter_37_10 TaxID=1974470 RepID=A0A2M7VF80_9BACT|nr:MAG: hypothetical protein COX77_01945 [Candidatus Komeilibacteria bacterium CG_4_10_14_0_2_um_filter_37_10]